MDAKRSKLLIQRFGKPFYREFCCAVNAEARPDIRQWMKC